MSARKTKETVGMSFGEQVPIAELHEDPNNANARDSIDDLIASLKEFGQHRPLVVKHDGTVIIGNHTLRAAVALGWNEVWAYRVDDDEARAVRRALADNRTSELRRFDDYALLDQLMNFDGASIPGFDGSFIEQLQLRVNPEHPGEFQEVGENLSTEYRCPKCGYEWSGKTA